MDAKKVYFGSLIILFGLLIAFRWSVIFRGTPNMIDVIIFTVFIGLLLSPIYSELSVGGISLKKDIEKAKNEFSDKIAELKVDLQNQIENKIDFSPTINIENKQDIKNSVADLQRNFPEVINDSLKGKIQVRDIEELPNSIDKKTLYMIASRYKIEKLLREIWELSDEKDSKWPSSVHYLAGRLYTAGIIDKDMQKNIKDIYNVTSPAVHGEIVSEVELILVSNLAPKVTASLNAIKNGYENPK